MAMTFGYEYPPGRKEDRFVKLVEDTAAGVTSLFLPESTFYDDGSSQGSVWFCFGAIEARPILRAVCSATLPLMA